MTKKIFSSILLLSLLFALLHAAEILQEITVKDGDTLWGVANKYLKDPRRWPEILKYNKLPADDPNRVLPGTKLKIPVLLIKENLRAAKLITVINQVQLRRNKKTEWEEAKLNTALYNEDSLRTLERSLAQVEFWSEEILRLGENSLVILRPEAKQEEAQLLRGEIRASKTRVIASQSIIQPKIIPRSPAPDFKANVRPDLSTLVSVYQGIVDVTAEGKTVTVPEGFSTEIKLKLPPAPPQPLPPTPKIELSGVATKKSSIKIITAPQINLSSNSKTAKGNQWHIQIAEDSEFKQIVFDKTVDSQENFPEFSQQLADGEYFLRLSILDQLGLESKFSPSRKITVDKTPPMLEIYSPQDEEKTTATTLKITGKTELPAELFVNQQEISLTESGKFDTEIILDSGINIINIKSVDQTGNAQEKNLTVEQINPYDLNNSSGKETKKAKSKLTIGNIAMAIVSGIVIGYVIFVVVP